MDKKTAKKQFDSITKKLDIEHTFTFDEAWDFLEYKRALSNVNQPDFKSVPQYSKDEFRKNIIKAEERMESHPLTRTKEEANAYNPLRHFFGDGIYIREIFNPAGEVVITKIHKVNHPFFLMKGTMSMLTDEGEQRISAPFYSITKAGTKRLIYAHTDCIFVTVHATDKTDIKEIEKDIIAENFEELKEAKNK
tara:strand:+ start:6639 stop:7217 length:579 start_codon:yes stop_codon:yes gene_type:complete